MGQRQFSSTELRESWFDAVGDVPRGIKGGLGVISPENQILRRAQQKNTEAEKNGSAEK